MPVAIWANLPGHSEFRALWLNWYPCPSAASDAAALSFMVHS